MSGARVSPGTRLAAIVLGGLCLLGSGFLLGRLAYKPEAPGPGYLQQLTEALDLRPDQVAALERVLSEEDRDLDQARLAIEALRALVPVLKDTVSDQVTRDFDQMVANMQLAYAKAVAES